MIRLGEKQNLIIVKKVDFGVYLAENEETAETDRVLLPKKQVPQDAEIGSEISVFIYRDSDDRMIATTTMPKIMLGQVAMLRVKEATKIGAFMDWGLEKDVLLPFKEQTRKVNAGEDVLCALYIDKSDRLAVTMNVYEFLRTDSPYQKDDKARGTVYEMSKNFGAFVAVDDIYSGLIPVKEITSNLRIGDDVTVRITGIKEDGKLNLSLRDKAYLQLDTDGEFIMKYMDAHNGKIFFTDKADPELIKAEMQMSKNQFKRAVGHLMKAGKVQILADCIERIDG